MPRQDVLETIRKYTDPFRVTKGKGFRLKDFDPGDTRGLKMDKQEAADLLERGSEWLAMEQDILYAQDSWALLLVFQAMDAAGKDGTIKHVMSRVNPQGVDVFSFKQPSDEELSHDFLWRYAIKVPQRGRIGIFNRSYTKKFSLCVCIKNCSRRRSCRRSWSTRGSGTSGWPISRALRTISRGRGCACSSSTSTCPGRSRRSDSWSASTSRTRTGSSPPRTCASAATGTITCTPTRRRSGRRRRRMRRGSSCPPITSGFPRLVVAAAIVEAVEQLDLEYPKVTHDQRKELAAARAELIAEK